MVVRNTFVEVEEDVQSEDDQASHGWNIKHVVR